MLPAPQLKSVPKPPALKTFRGIGGRLVGSFPEPAVPGSYYKQFVVTVLYIPVFFGHVYLVEDDEAKKMSWKFLGHLEGDGFVARFGWPAYLKFKASSLLDSSLMFLGLAALLVAVSYVRAHLS